MHFVRAVIVVSSLLGACAPVWAQATGEISGTVRDASGAVVPGTEIKATQTATGAVRTVTSGADGGFALPNLSIGPYLLEATKQGFSKYVESGLQLSVDSNPTIDITLKVGAANEQVTVEATSAQIETHSNNVGQVVDNQRVAEMPLNGRNPIELVFLAGMATQPGDGAINTVRNYPTVVVSVAGGQGNGVGYQLDGAIFQDPYNSLAMPLPFPDALQEFKIETSALPAQYGYHSTATVNAVTKSGTNTLHGDLFEFLRNGDLNARDFFSATRDTLKRNQWGGTIGGHIIRDKLFFFAGYQRTSQRADTSSLTGYVPTARMESGDFSIFAKPTSAGGCQTKQFTLTNGPGGAPFAGNIIPVSLFSPVAVKFVATLPAATNECGLTKYGFANISDEDLPVGRIDWLKSEKHTIFGRYNAGNLSRGSTFSNNNPLSVNNYAVKDFDYQLALGDTYLIGNSIVNGFRLAGSRTNVAKSPDAYKNWADFGANYTPVPGGETMVTTVSGGLGFNIGSTGNVPGQSHNGPNLSVTDDVTWVKGNHQFGFGGNWYHQMMNYWSGLNAVGSTTFNGQYTGAGNAANGLGMADLLLGYENGFSQGTTYGFYNRQNYLSSYIEDSWKITPRLTMNVGVRWEPFLGQYSKYGQIHFVDPTLFAAGYHSPVYTNAPAGVIFPGDPHYPCGKSFNCDDWHKFLPRLGLAWDPMGDGKTVVRAAFGQFEDRTHMFYHNVMSFGPPFGDVVSAPAARIDNQWANYPGGNPIPNFVQFVGVGSSKKDAPFPAFGNYVDFPTAGFKPMYVNQWNFSIQHQFGSWLLTANYLGNSTIHMTTSVPINPAVYIPGNCAAGQYGLTAPGACSSTANQNFRRVFYLQNQTQGQYYAGVGQALDSGTASYEGLYIAANKALGKGLTLTTNFTWSHCITVPYDQQTGAAGVAPPGNLNAYRGSCPGDIRESFVLNAVYTTPKMANRIANLLVSGWQIAPILQIRSGQALTVTAGTDQSLTTIPGQTANQVLPDPYCSSKGINCWLNPNSFAIPALGTTSQARYGSVAGPGQFQMNLALSRTFRLYEKQTIQLRGEAFNLPNTLNPANPTTARNSGTFGIIQADVNGSASFGSSGDYRVIQVAAKYVF